MAKGVKWHHSDKSDGDNTNPRKMDSVPPEDREEAVLAFLDDHGIALPPKAIYRGMKVERNITFAYRTVQNILARLLDAGEVVRCDKEALDEGKIVALGPTDSDRRTYYFITEKGRRRIGRDE